MSYIDVVLVGLVIIILVLFVFRNKTVVVKKSSEIKKQEIIDEYKQKLQMLIELHKDDSEILKQEKLNFIKNVNAQLNKNIFFNQIEIKKIIYELTIL
jgi:biopolymer transport protein ExbD